LRPEKAVDSAKSQFDKEYSEGDPLIEDSYVSNFLKEIDEIETMNHRADKYIENRTLETNMR